MKSKRRHELQTNELADQLGHWIDAVRPHVTTIVLGVTAVAVAIAAYFYWTSNKEKLVSESWRAYIHASSNPSGDMVKDLKSVGDQFDDTQAGLWASQTAADIEGGQAVRSLFTAKATAQTGLGAARRGYEDVLENEALKPSPMLERRARFGLAQVLEAEGSLDKAIKEYEKVAKAAPDSSLGKAAKRRAEHLAKDSTQQWYAWFAMQTPAPPAKPESSLFPDGLGQPGDPSALPGGAGSSFLDSFGTDPSSGSVPAEKPESGTTGDAEVAAEAGDTGTDAETTEESPKVDGPSVEGPAMEGPATEPATEPAKKPVGGDSGGAEK